MPQRSRELRTRLSVVTDLDAAVEPVTSTNASALVGTCLRPTSASRLVLADSGDAQTERHLGSTAPRRGSPSLWSAYLAGPSAGTTSSCHQHRVFRSASSQTGRASCSAFASRSTGQRCPRARVVSPSDSIPASPGAAGVSSAGGGSPRGGDFRCRRKITRGDSLVALDGSRRQARF
jgi:hypothetical protein